MSVTFSKITFYKLSEKLLCHNFKQNQDMSMNYFFGVIVRKIVAVQSTCILGYFHWQNYTYSKIFYSKRIIKSKPFSFTLGLSDTAFKYYCSFCHPYTIIYLSFKNKLCCQSKRQLDRGEIYVLWSNEKPLVMCLTRSRLFCCCETNN